MTNFGGSESHLLRAEHLALGSLNVEYLSFWPLAGVTVTVQRQATTTTTTTTTTTNNNQQQQQQQQPTTTNNNQKATSNKQQATSSNNNNQAKLNQQKNMSIQQCYTYGFRSGLDFVLEMVEMLGDVSSVRFNGRISRDPTKSIEYTRIVNNQVVCNTGPRKHPNEYK